MVLKQLLERLEYRVIQGSGDTEVTEPVSVSDKVNTGAVFVCIRGHRADGHRFIPEAVRNGAAAVVVEKAVAVPEHVTVIRVKDTRYALALMSAAYYGYPAEKLRVIGVTGTKGKTTTAYMIRSILMSTGHRTGLIGTVEAVVGEKHYPAANTTPESSDDPAVFCGDGQRRVRQRGDGSVIPGADAPPDGRDSL